MKKVLTGALVALGLSSGAALAAPKDPSGTWLTEDGRARIRIEKCPGRADRVCGYAVWLKTPNDDKGQPRVDFKNTDAKKRSRPSLGHQLIMGLKPNADNRYEGQIYNADDGKLYDVSIWTEEPAELNVRGCLMGFLCGSQTWTRVNDVAPGQLTAATGAPNGPRPDAEWAAAPKAAAPAAPAKPAAAPVAAPKQ